MNRKVRRKLDMAARALGFSRAQPYDKKQYNDILARLEERLTRALALDTQQYEGQLAVRNSTARKAFLRRVVQNEHLRHLAAIAESAAVDAPELGTRFRAPPDQVNHQGFLTAARAIANAAQPHKDLFVGYGLPETFLEDLDAALAEYEQAVNEVRVGVTSHVGANADLEAVADEVMQLVDRLSAMNRYRFRKDPEQLAAWKSARNVAWPLRPESKVKPAA